MKKSLILASLVAASTSMMAMDSQYFLGAGAGASWGKWNEKATVTGPVLNTTLSDSATDSATTMLLKGGVILDKTHRLSLSYTPSMNSDANIHSFFAGYDYLIPLNNESRFYVGTHAGVSSFKGKDDIDGVNMSGFTYGAQGGYIYDISKNIEFEIGAMYTKLNLEDTGSYVELGHNVSWKFEQESAISSFIGINYKF